MLPPDESVLTIGVPYRGPIFLVQILPGSRRGRSKRLRLGSDRDLPQHQDCGSAAWCCGFSDPVSHIALLRRLILAHRGTAEPAGEQPERLAANESGCARISLRCASMRRKIALNSPGIWGISAKMAPQLVSRVSPGLQA